MATFVTNDPLVATDDEKVVEHYRSFGRKLGIAFQTVGDILEIWGGLGITGKPQGINLKSKKKTLPLLHAVTVAAPEQGKE